MKVLAQFGNVENPCKIFGCPTALSDSTRGSGLISLLSTIFQTAIVLAGLYTLFNFLLAGYTFLGAGGDPKKIQQAWEKIYLSVIGLLIVAGSLVLAGIVGFLVFGNAYALIAPRIFNAAP